MSRDRLDIGYILGVRRAQTPRPTAINPLCCQTFGGCFERFADVLHGSSTFGKSHSDAKHPTYTFAGIRRRSPKIGYTLAIQSEVC